MKLKEKETSYEPPNISSEGKTYSFPWRALMLCLLRLSVAVSCYWFGPSHNNINIHGSIKETRALENKYKYYMYSHSHIKKPALQMTLSGDPGYEMLTAVSATGLLLAILLDMWRRRSQLVHDGSGEVPNKRVDLWDMVVFLLVVLELTLAALDLVNNTASLLYHTHLVMFNIGFTQALSYLVLGLTLVALQMYLWLGAFHFHNNVKEDLSLKSE